MPEKPKTLDVDRVMRRMLLFFFFGIYRHHAEKALVYTIKRQKWYRVQREKGVRWGRDKHGYKSEGPSQACASGVGRAVRLESE
jgi:hypothetical protein